MIYTLELYREYYEFDELLKPFVRDIEEPCFNSEFQFLTRGTLYWDIPGSENFRFQEAYFIKGKVPLFEHRIWEKASGLSGTDGVFAIPVVIKYRGEQHHYYIAVPSRLRCLDSHGRIVKRDVGRYLIFKSDRADDPSLYVTERLMSELKDSAILKFKGVE